MSWWSRICCKILLACASDLFRSTLILTFIVSFVSIVTFKETIFNSILLIFFCFSDPVEVCVSQLCPFLCHFFYLFHIFRDPLGMCIMDHSDWLQIWLRIFELPTSVSQSRFRGSVCDLCIPLVGEYMEDLSSWYSSYKSQYWRFSPFEEFGHLWGSFRVCSNLSRWAAASECDTNLGVRIIPSDILSLRWNSSAASWVRTSLRQLQRSFQVCKTSVSLGNCLRGNSCCLGL